MAAGSRSDPINEGIRMTARLDAFTLQDVLDMIDRSQSVTVVSNGHYIVIDDDPNAVAAAETEMAELAQIILPAQGQLLGYDNTDSATTSSPVPVIGYVSHGINDGPGGLDTEYIENQLGFELARGAVFQTYESFNAQTFTEGASQSQGLVAEWIAIGGTAGLGHVSEPYARRENITNENIFYDMLAPGGLLLATNVDSSNPNRNSMDFVLEWHLVHRNQAQLQALNPDRATPNSFCVKHESTGVNIFIEVRKPQ